MKGWSGMLYEIFEGNIERLEKKLARIQNKCIKYGCDFHFEVVSETYHEIYNKEADKAVNARFVVVDVEGKAIVNDWQFVAFVEHTEKGNIFSGVSGIEVPERYYNAKPVCEHCNTNHYRKHTYIVMNTKTGEFKQVGKSCLNDFTHGMSAEFVAQYISYFNELIQGNTPYEGCHIENYIDIKEALAYIAETIRAFGYVKSQDENRYTISTKVHAFSFYCVDHGIGNLSNGERKLLNEEMERYSFNLNSSEVASKVEVALEWIAEQKDENEYMHNLKTVCALEYVTYKNFGILASLFPTYYKSVERSKNQEVKATSQHVGNIKDRIRFEVKDYCCVTNWDTQWGTTFLYEFVDNNGNIFTWKTSNAITDKFTTITGTIKAHNEYKSVKQTELTRCKLS